MITSRYTETSGPSSTSGIYGERHTTASSRLIQLFGTATVLTMVLVTPWLFGGVQAKSQVWLFGATLLALSCSLLAIRSEQGRTIRLPLAFLPLVFAIALGGFQLLPLDRELRAILSPSAVASEDALDGKMDDLTESWRSELNLKTVADREPLSLYPTSTRHDLALLILAVSIFFLGVVFFASPKTHLWLLGLVVANGVAIAFFGLTQKLSWNGLLYWSIPLTQGGVPFGPFVNRNNAGGYLVLCFAGGLGVTIWCLQRYLPTQLFHGFGSKRSPWQFMNRRSIEIIAALNARTLAALTATGFLGAAVLSTLSRGASVALVMATLLAISIARLSRRRSESSAGWLLVVSAIGAGLVFWAGLAAAVETRMATLLDTRIGEYARIQHWQDGLEAARDFWPVGSGLGTYRFVYRQYQDQLRDSWFYHAENQYLEALVDGGIVGLGCLLAVLILVAMAAWRLLKWDPDPRSAVFAIACTLAVVGQAIAAFFDFGLYIPANMLLFALLCGALTGRAACVTKAGDEVTKSPSRPQRWAATMAACCLFGAGLWGMSELRVVSCVERALKDIRLSQVLHEFSVSAIDPFIDQLDVARALQPDNAEVQRRMAELWIQRYRALTLEQVQQKTTFEADDPRLYQLTLPMVIHQRIHFLKNLGLTDELAQLRSREVIQENLIPAVHHLLKSRESCSLLPEVHSGIAQLCGLVDDPAVDRIHIDRIAILAPSDADLMYTCGLLQQHAGRHEEARAYWKQSLSLSHRHLSNVLDLANPWLTNAGTIEQLLPNSPDLLINLARKQFSAEEDQAVRTLLLERAADLIEKIDLQEAERLRLRGSVFALQRDYASAFSNYVQAVRRRPETVEWRYEYARLLYQAERWDEARQQAVWCLQLAPNDAKHRKLLESINNARFSKPKP